MFVCQDTCGLSISVQVNVSVYKKEGKEVEACSNINGPINVFFALHVLHLCK